MTSIRKFAYATLLAFTALNIAPSLASAQEPARGKFTLTHEVHWGNAKLPAGDYEFSFDPDATSRMLSLRKLSGTRAGYLLLVPSTEDTKPTDLSRLVLESTPDGSYVSAMQLPEFGMTLHFNVRSHTAEKQIAKAATTAAASGQ
jgi:hypothetical protein